MESGACTLVAIARNEEKHILEWLAYHLAVGFDSIIVFDHGSTDGTALKLDEAAARSRRIVRVAWHRPSGPSPQRASYNHALSLVATPWVAFCDIDEFIVPWRHGRIDRHLASMPDDVSALHVNWRSFGSGGRSRDDYVLVTEAFVRCAPADWFSQQHYKTLARVDCIEEAFVHHAVMRSGRRVMSDGHDVDSTIEGIADRVVYDGIQVNHYQVKTRSEFERRMAAGYADQAEGSVDAKRRLETVAERFAILDRNEEEDHRIAPFLPGLKEQLAILSAGSSLGRRWLRAARHLLSKARR